MTGRVLPGWRLLVLVLVVVPLALTLAVPALLFAVFGDPIPLDSTGDHLLVFWTEQGGREITSGAAALVVLLARRVRPVVALALAVAAGALAFVWFIAALLAWILFFGGSLE